MVKRAVFLDRDGVVTQEPPYYAHRLDQLALIPQSAGAIHLLNESGYIVVVISNQSGIARGYYTEQDMNLFNQGMIKKLAEFSAHVDAIYFCPHHPEAGKGEYRMECDCRKPKPGMLIKAKGELNIDMTRSFLVGDKQSDMEAGNSAGCKTILVKTGQGIEEIKKRQFGWDYLADNLYNAVQIILKHV